MLSDWNPLDQTQQFIEPLDRMLGDVGERVTPIGFSLRE
jgi:hypothetical protein